jgi:integrase
MLFIIQLLIDQISDCAQMKIFEIIELWQADKKQYIKKSSYSAYHILIANHLLPAFGNKTDVTEADAQIFVLKKMKDGIKQKTVQDILIVLQMILKFGAKHKWIHHEKFNVQYPSSQKLNKVEVLSRAHQIKIMSYIQTNITFKNLGIYICLSAGIRIGEVCALKWQDIDIVNGVIKVKRTIQRIYMLEGGRKKTELFIDSPKTKNSLREIPISKELLKMLRPVKQIVNDSNFVLTNDIKPTEPRTYRCYYMKFMKQLNIPHMKFHGLRHSFATRCIESKCDYKTVSVLLGHSNITTTLNLYVHPNLEQKKKCIEQMFKILK